MSKEDLEKELKIRGSGRREDLELSENIGCQQRRKETFYMSCISKGNIETNDDYTSRSKVVIPYFSLQTEEEFGRGTHIN